MNDDILVNFTNKMQLRKIYFVYLSSIRYYVVETDLIWKSIIQIILEYESHHVEVLNDTGNFRLDELLWSPE